MHVRLALRRSSSSGIRRRSNALQPHSVAMLDTVRSPGRCRFAFSAAYPTPIESAALAASSDKKPMPRLVCGKCNATLSATKDLVFFRWRNGIHVSNATDESLKNLFPENAVEEDDTSWKKHKMLCIKCNHQVGTLARVFSSDRVLFSAARVAIQMSEAQSPLLSLSGYPSSVLSFAMWSELILIAETQPQLKGLLQIRRVDTIQQHSTDTAKLNRKILMAKDLQELLRVVDENVLELNQYNIRTAIDRAGRFVATRTSRVDLPAVSSSNSLNKSEAPEDELLVVPSPNLSPRLSTKPTALDTKRFWNLIDETEKLVNFGIAAFKTGQALSNLTTALMRLGVGRATILQPVAAQAVFLMQADKPRMSAHEACMVATAIVHLLPRERRRNDWVLDTLQATSKMVMSELDGENASVEDKQRAAEVLIPLARSFLFAESFDNALFRRAFREMNSRALTKLNLPPHKLRVLMSKAYQVHLDCELNGRSSDLRLSPAFEDECKQAFDAHQRKSKSSSYRLHHLVCTALDELGIANETSYGVETSYHFDVAAPKQRIAIEINQSDCYGVLEPGDEDEEPKTFGFVDLKTRHLKLLGWTVINLHADRFLQRKTLEDRVMYLSMLLEIVTCREWKPTQLNRSGSRSKQPSIR